MANKKFEEEQRLLMEKRELLKLKQGLVEESEVIDEPTVREKVELHGWKKVENFFYHYKWRVLAICLAAVFIGVMTVQALTKERNDLYVLVISTSNDSGLYTKRDDIEKTLERYCPDFDGNGYVHVGVNFINLSTETGVSDYTNAENLKFTSEIATGDSQMYIADTGIVAIMNEIGKGEIQYFQPLSEQYTNAEFCDDGQGLRLNSTGFTELARWASCPDKVAVYVRGEYKDMTGNGDDAQEQRDRAMTVFDNIINGNIVNPAAGEKD